MRYLQQLPWQRIIKFGLVGGSALALDFLVYYALTRFGHVPYLAGRAISIACAFSWNFTLNRNWTFQAQAGQVKQQASRFVIIMTLTSFLNLGLMRIGVSVLGWNDLLVIAVVSLLIMGINFFAHQFWSYNVKPVKTS